MTALDAAGLVLVASDDAGVSAAQATTVSSGASSSVWQPGLVQAALGEVPIPTVLFSALSDVLCIVAAIAIVAIASSLIEKAFKAILGQFVSDRTVFALEGYLTYPGVAFHEASHALFAFLTGGRNIKISLRREEVPGVGHVLGSVTYVPSANPLLGSVQRIASGVAPAFTGLVAMVAMLLFAFPACDQWWQWVIWIYLFICVLLHSELSGPDIASAIGGIPWIALILFCIFLIFPFDPFALASAIAGMGTDAGITFSPLGWGDGGASGGGSGAGSGTGTGGGSGAGQPSDLYIA